MIAVEIPQLSEKDSRVIATNAARIREEQNVSPNDYVVGLHINVDGVAPFVELVSSLRCRAFIVEPSAKARILLEKNLWLNTYDESLAVYCPESGFSVPDVDLDTYSRSIVILPDIVHNKYERAVLSRNGKSIRKSEYGMRCQSFQDIIGKRNVVATVLGDLHVERAARGMENRMGEIVITNAAAQKATNIDKFEDTLFAKATLVL